MRSDEAIVSQEVVHTKRKTVAERNDFLSQGKGDILQRLRYCNAFLTAGLLASLTH